jgi:hypothetical protein
MRTLKLITAEKVGPEYQWRRRTLYNIGHLGHQGGQEAVEAGSVTVVASVEVGAQHEDDLHEGNATDSTDVPQLRQVADLEKGFENEIFFSGTVNIVCLSVEQASS